MSDAIYPRSPREEMNGWCHLPRYIDKIRLFLAGRLGADYLPLFGKNSDAIWLAAAGVTHEQMIEVVRGTITDGEVCDWVRTHIHKTSAEKAAHRAAMVDFPPAGDADAQAFFEQRKALYGMAHRKDITNRGDMLDADEGRIG
jgi:Domain of unknown function (DUF5069)